MTYIALHHHSDVPLEKRVPGYEGLWIDVDYVRGVLPAVIHLPHDAFAVPTDRIEWRYDGEDFAQVWEVRVVDTAWSALTH